MRDRACAGLALLTAAGSAAASPMDVEGVVVDARSRWTASGSRIVTEATVRTPDGDEVVVSQLGGSVDGLAMRVSHGPEMLVPGMRVALGARAALDLAQRTHVVVESVRVLAAPPGYVRTGPTRGGNYLKWASGCVFVRVDPEGTRQIAGDAEFAIVAGAIAEWNDRADACSYLRIVDDGRAPTLTPRAGPPIFEVGTDKINVIKFRDVTWCRPAEGDDPPRCHADSAAGITTTVFVDDPTSDRDGEIVDADIELNGVNFAISSNGVTLGDPSKCKADLANTLTHELGHLLGIEHPCRASGDPPRVDHRGEAVPLCSTVTDPAILDSTMFNFQECGETMKATLEAEDVAAVCGIYPTAEDPGTCERVDETGCCGSTRGGVPPGTMLLAGLVLWLARRSRLR